MTKEARCRVCGRVIRKQPWVDRGIGPDCYAALKRGKAEEEYPVEIHDGLQVLRKELAEEVQA